MKLNKLGRYNKFIEGPNKELNGYKYLTQLIYGLGEVPQEALDFAKELDIIDEGGRVKECYVRIYKFFTAPIPEYVHAIEDMVDCQHISPQEALQWLLPKMKFPLKILVNVLKGRKDVAYWDLHSLPLTATGGRSLDMGLITLEKIGIIRRVRERFQVLDTSISSAKRSVPIFPSQEKCLQELTRLSQEMGAYD